MRGSELLWRRCRDRHEVTIFGHEYCATRLDDRSDGARALAASLARPRWSQVAAVLIAVAGLTCEEPATAGRGALDREIGQQLRGIVGRSAHVYPRT